MCIMCIMRIVLLPPRAIVLPFSITVSVKAYKVSQQVHMTSVISNYPPPV